MLRSVVQLALCFCALTSGSPTWQAKKQEKADKEAGKRAKRAAARAGAGTSRCLGGRASDNSDVPQEHAEEILLPAA